jgi:NAD(P)H-hydrate epimerase
VPRGEVANYIEESDAVLIGPGLMRESETREITKILLEKFPQKKWVIDAGSLQMMDPSWLNENCLITPHKNEFATLFKTELEEKSEAELISILQSIVNKYKCTILLKGMADIVCSPKECKISEGGNPGMTKGGTGDVLAGLAAALACKNDLFIAVSAASFINKRAGEELAKKVGYWFNASDLADQIPQTMKNLLL